MLDAFGRVYATGKRKTSVARVWLWRGMGNVSINKRAFEHYFQDFTKRADVLSPFRVSSKLHHILLEQACHGTCLLSISHVFMMKSTGSEKST